VPGLVISPYARHGFIDHQVLSFDAYDKFIEDDFLNGQRIDPRADGRPDLRPDVREDVKILGNLVALFSILWFSIRRITASTTSLVTGAMPILDGALECWQR
jgi:hypothetical protein